MLLKYRRCASQSKQMPKNARQRRHGGHPATLSRWNDDAEYRKSLSNIGWKEYHIMIYGTIALETHINKATRAERIQNANNRILTTNSEGGTHLSLTQRPDFAPARCSSQSTNKTAKRQRKMQQFKGHEDLDYVVGPNTGWRFVEKLADICVKLAGQRHRCQRGNEPSGRRAIGNLSTFQVLTSGVVSQCLDRFRLPREKPSKPTDGECEQYTHKHNTHRVAHSITCHVSPSFVCFLSYFSIDFRQPQHFGSTMNSSL